MEPIHPSLIQGEKRAFGRSGRFRLPGKSPLSFRISIRRVLAHYVVAIQKKLQHASSAKRPDSPSGTRKALGQLPLGQ